MTEPDDREPHPPAPKPADTRGAGLPPRLREKLLEAEEKAAGGGATKSPVVGLALAALVIAAIVGVVWWMIHSDQAKEQAAAERVAAGARAVALADSLDAVARADSLAAAARADSIAFAALPKAQQRKLLAARAKQMASAAAAGAGTTPAPAPSAPATGAATAAAPVKPSAGTAVATHVTRPSDSTATQPAAPKEKGPFVIDAGHFLDQARATEVADDLKVKTKLPTQVMSMGAGGEALYHVLVGTFSTRSAAEATANKLFAKGVVEEAAVIPLPKTP